MSSKEDTTPPSTPSDVTLPGGYIIPRKSLLIGGAAVFASALVYVATKLVYRRQETASQRFAREQEQENYDLYNSALKLFQKHFHKPPTHGAVAPGRVNIIGEHTDYTDGFVLPMAIGKVTYVVGRYNGLDR